MNGKSFFKEVIINLIVEKIRSITAIAPIRICDIGGWTDTWFAQYGTIFNIAVYPYVEVQAKIEENKDCLNRVEISVENFGYSYEIDPNHITYDKHPLIEAAIDLMKIPKGVNLKLNIFSDAPPGASTGTSAAVSVALIGILAKLSSLQLTPYEIAALAHSIEINKLKLQSGIQDQLCSAYGGINFIQMHQYPNASVSSIQIPNNIWWELENRLTVIYIGTPHASSEIHKKVIAGLGENAYKDPRMDRLRQLAFQAKESIYKGDFIEFGKIMNDNTEVQRQLHPDLVCSKFEDIISLASEFNCIGSKVNGAGGNGGSITLLGNGDMSIKRKMLRHLYDLGYKILPIYLSRQGLRIW
jgi:D-glycero-alpha-D-manno-heptose-7-phosphate kinase